VRITIQVNEYNDLYGILGAMQCGISVGGYRLPQWNLCV